MHKCSGEFSLLVPAVVVIHADNNDIVADIDIIHPEYELVDGTLTAPAWALMGEKARRDFRVQRKKSD